MRINAPHVLASVVMPGHIGTDIAVNTGKVLGKPDPMSLDTQAVNKARALLVKRGFPVGNLPDDAIRQALKKRVDDFKTNAPTSARDAAQTILSGVREEQWRILVGEDAHALDRLVSAAPERAYEDEFIE